MEELTIEQSLELYPHLKSLTDHYLFTTKQDIEQIKNGPQIEVYSEKIPVEYLKRILENETYLEYASKYLRNEINDFNVGYITNGDIGGVLRFKKGTMLKGIEKIIESKEIILTPETEKRYQSLKEEISYDKFKNEYFNKSYDVTADNYNYSIPINQLISIMELNDEQFNDICTNNEIKTINGIPKEHFLYAALKFFYETKAAENFLIPDNITDNHETLRALQKIDIQAINQLLTTTDTKYKNININNELENTIISGMPKDASELEKAIYIYIKMCKLLSYDEEYYAVDQRGTATEKHKDINHISSITLKNNKVVCFEFNLIYSKLLNDLGLHFESDYKGMEGESYGFGHANLKFRSGKFLIKADSVTSILDGDIMRSKLNQPLVGITCLNKNEQTQQEFNNSLAKMYQLVAEQDESIKKNPIGHKQTLEELLEEYKKVTNNIHEISLNEKLSLLIDKVNSTKMTGIDSLSYVLQLRKIFFTEEERKNNIGVTIIRNNKPFEENRIAMASAIFTINNQSFEENEEPNIYYYFNPNNELIPISKEEVQEKFNNGTFEYITKNDPKIPGIIENGGIKK